MGTAARVATGATRAGDAPHSRIMLADTTVGRPWDQDLAGRLHWIASAVDTHIIYRVAFRRVENILYVTNVLVFPTPPDPNND